MGTKHGHNERSKEKRERNDPSVNLSEQKLIGDSQSLARDGAPVRPLHPNIILRIQHSKAREEAQLLENLGFSSRKEMLWWKGRFKQPIEILSYEPRENRKGERKEIGPPWSRAKSWERGTAT